MKILHIVTFLLTIVGALNWGLVGVGGFFHKNLNVVHMVFSSIPVLEGVTYILVGLSAIYLVVTHKKECRMCGTGM